MNIRNIACPLIALTSCLTLVGCHQPQQSVKPGINERFKGDFKIGPWLERFESESREVYDQRRTILDDIDLAPGMEIADIGAGTGFFSFMFADVVGDSGIVYAVDIARPFIDHINNRAASRQQPQIKTILCEDDNAKLPPRSIDRAFICDTYHHFEYPQSTMASIAQALRPGGTLFVIDFRRYEEGAGIDDSKWMSLPTERQEWIRGHVRCDRQTIIEEIEAAGLRHDENFQPRCNAGMVENYMIRFTRLP